MPGWLTSIPSRGPVWESRYKLAPQARQTSLHRHAGRSRGRDDRHTIDSGYVFSLPGRVHWCGRPAAGAPVRVDRHFVGRPVRRAARPSAARRAVVTSWPRGGPSSRFTSVTFAAFRLHRDARPQPSKEGFGPARWVKSCFVGRGQLPGRASAPRALELLPGRLTRAGRCVGAFGPVLAQRALLRAAKRFSLAFLARSPFGGTGQWAPLRLPLQSGVGSIFLVASSRLSAISVAHTRSSARFGPTGTGPNQSVIRV